MIKSLVGTFDVIDDVETDDETLAETLSRARDETEGVLEAATRRGHDEGEGHERCAQRREARDGIGRDVAETVWRSAMKLLQEAARSREETIVVVDEDDDAHDLHRPEELGPSALRFCARDITETKVVGLGRDTPRTRALMGRLETLHALALDPEEPLGDSLLSAHELELLARLLCAPRARCGGEERRGRGVEGETDACDVAGKEGGEISELEVPLGAVREDETDAQGLRGGQLVDGAQGVEQGGGGGLGKRETTDVPFKVTLDADGAGH